MKRDSHILKIVHTGRTFREDIGIKCNPEQTYGISQQSPDQFKKPYSLTARNGYMYNYDEQHPSNIPAEEQLTVKNSRKYAVSAFSQRRYASVVGDTIDQVTDFKNIYHQSLNDDGTVFRKKKGRMTDFMEKNGWMNKTFKLMGFERTDVARQTANKVRQNKINSLPKRNKFNNPVAIKPYPKQSRTSSFLYSEKSKIRESRFSFRQKNNASLEIQRSISPPKEKYIEAEQISNKLGRTMLDKQWRSTMSTIRKKSNESGSKKLGLTFSDWKDNYKTMQVREQSDNGDHLKQWFNTTCNSHANPWKYRKARKIDTNSSQQQIGNDY